MGWERAFLFRFPIELIQICVAPPKPAVSYRKYVKFSEIVSSSAHFQIPSSIFASFTCEKKSLFSESHPFKYYCIQLSISSLGSSSSLTLILGGLNFLPSFHPNYPLLKASPLWRQPYNPWRLFSIIIFLWVCRDMEQLDSSCGEGTLEAQRLLTRISPDAAVSERFS